MTRSAPADSAGGGRPPSGDATRPTIRLDKWLFHARFLKSRGLASDLVGEGRLRVNGEATAKPHRPVGPGDVLTFVLHGQVRVVRILHVGARRGPAPEAQALYEDLAPERSRAPEGADARDPPSA